VLHLLQLWLQNITATPSLVLAVVRTLLPLVQQLQSCGPQLIEAAAAAAAGSAYQQNCACMLQTTFLEVQQTVAVMLFTLDPMDNDIVSQLQLEGDVAQQVQGLLNEPAVVELLLQNLTASTAVMHKYHVAYRQKEQQQQEVQQPKKQQETQQLQQQRHAPAGYSSSSSSAAGSRLKLQQQQQPAQSTKQQLHADLPPIPAFHTDMLHLLPGGQAYMAGITAALASSNMSKSKQLGLCRTLARSSCYALYRYLLCSFGKPAAEQQKDALLSVAGVRLLIEVQLLAAAHHQRWQQQQQQQQQQPTAGQGDSLSITATLLSCSTRLLYTLIRAVAQASGSCLPPEILQQPGLQLLQALAAPLQQLQLSRDEVFLQYATMLSAAGARGYMGGACHALMAAACGPAGHAVNGEMHKCGKLSL
jgi:hypothetical protein